MKTKIVKIVKGNLWSRQTRQMLANPAVNIIVDNFHGVNWWKKTKVFPIFTIYHNPKDFPEKYVVRLFDGKAPTRLLAVKDTLEEARKTIPPLFKQMDRSPIDDPVIVETWL